MTMTSFTMMAYMAATLIFQTSNHISLVVSILQGEMFLVLIVELLYHESKSLMVSLKLLLWYFIFYYIFFSSLHFEILSNRFISFQIYSFNVFSTQISKLAYPHLYHSPATIPMPTHLGYLGI